MNETSGNKMKLERTADIVLLLLLTMISASNHLEAQTLSKPNDTTSDTQKPSIRAIENQQQLSLGGACEPMGSCRRNSRSPRDLDGGVDKRSCYCDQRCSIYDDCCPDSRWAKSFSQRLQTNRDELRRTRRQWYCHRVNPIFGDVLLKATCSDEWMNRQTDIQAARIVQKRCEYVKDRGKWTEWANGYQMDPLGMMMPITDLASEITYANSYCLRCNSHQNKPQSQPKFIYWTPMLDCNYDIRSDDRETLKRLIGSSKRQVLQYSTKLNKWVINTNLMESNNGTSSDRVCSVTPTIPDSVDHKIRFCKANTIDFCPEEDETQPGTLATSVNNSSSLSFKEIKSQCEHGHQSLTYSQRSDAVYYNLACAKCNNEKQVFCQKKKKKKFGGLVYKIVVANSNRTVNSSPPLESDINGEMDSEEQEKNTSESQDEVLNPDGTIKSRTNDPHHPGRPISGSFSVLMDLYGSSQGDEQVGAIHQCRDAQNQVYDPFFFTCRDVVCGLNHHYIDGKCVATTEEIQDNLYLNTSILFPPSNNNNSTSPENGDAEQSPPINQDNNRDQASSSMGSSGSESREQVTSGEGQLASSSKPDEASQSNKPASQVVVLAVTPFSVSTTLATGRSLDLIHSANSTRTTRAREDEEGEEETTTSGLPASSRSPRGSRGDGGGLVEEVARVEEKPFQVASSEQVSAELKINANEQSSQLKAMKNDSDSDYLKMLNSLNSSELPQATLETRRQYIDCGKILIEPEHYRLFGLSPSNGSSQQVEGGSTLAGSKLIPIDGSPAEVRRKQEQSATFWALVAPYNLTLAPSQFELVRSAASQPATSGKPRMKLLICSPFTSDLVDKFKPAMVYVTIVGLTISIASLSLYLLLYCLSMVDLRRLVTEMAQHRHQRQVFDQMEESGLDRARLGRSSQEANSTCGSVGGSSTATRSQSLSSRGVACLAGSLLAAYLLFLVGNSRQEPESGGSLGYCALLAIGTYYCFMVAFNWMFLLSYDIWRTLRLATCQLRGPALHSQSRRFITYTLFALLASGLVVGLAVLADQLPLSCVTGLSANNQQRQPASCSSTFQQELAQFLQIYRPKFGQRPGSCWFSNRRALALFFGLPVSLIMLLNLIFFLHSSFMVIRTSSRSSRHLAASSKHENPNKQQQQAAECPKLVAVVSRVHSTASSVTTDTTTCHDYASQNSLTTNSLISVQTIQSQLADESSASSLSNESPECCADKPPVGATSEGSLESEPANPEPVGGKRKLEASQSSSSLTNQSIGGSSIAASLAHKYDTQIANLGCLMGSLVKDYRLYCRLSTIMGLTWLTGLFASFVDQSELLWYLFVVLNTLQGLFVFIAFGCKRSKLSNVLILLSYLRFRWSRA